MDLKKFKLNLENTLGKRLDKLNKDMLTTKLDLDKAKSNIQELNIYLENKHTKNRLSVPLRQSPIKKSQAMQEEKLNGNSCEESKLKPIEISIKPMKDAAQIPQKTVKLEPPKLAFNIIKRPNKQYQPRAALDQIIAQIKDLELHYPSENLNSQTVFTVSLGAKSAFDIIKGMSKETFRLADSPDKKILWAFGLLIQLLGEDFSVDAENAKARVQEFLNCCLDSPNISEFFMSTIKSFDFSNENIDGVEEYIFGKDEMVAPQTYTNVSQLCGLLMVALREAVAFCGFIKGKTPIWRVYQRLLYKKKVLETNI